MSLSSPQSSARVLPARATSVAHRLLAGAGTASFVAYRRDPEHAIAVPAHGLTPRGELVVAHLAGDVPAGATGVTDVRVDIRREATEAQTRILSATVHLLGHIEWVSPSVRAGLLVGEWMPESVRVMAAVPNAAIGIVSTERVMLHDGSGVSSLPMTELVGVDPSTVFPTAYDEFDAHEAVAALGPRVLSGIFAAALTDRLPHEVLSERAAQPPCGTIIGRIFCVDVGSLGLTLMHVGATSTTVVFVPFSEPVPGHAELRARLADLLSTARS